MKNKLFRNILIIVISLLVVFGLIGFYFVSILSTPNIYTKQGEVSAVDIPDDAEIKDVINLLSEQVEIRNVQALKKAMDILNYKTVRSGHYEISNGMSNKDFVLKLQRGLQTPVRVTFNNIRTKEELARSLSRQLMPDSLQIINLLNNESFLSNYQLNKNNVLVVFIPDTYEFFWNTDEKKIFERMYREYTKFWTKERLEKAAEIPLTPIEVSILASIVEEETNKSFEYPIVAGLYINRLKKGMLLQADPTVKFAVGDFTIRRVLNVHLQTDSPYNTYRYKGLPPGPIRIPSARVVDSVLNYQKHNYLYMVAKETLNGEHNFAVTLNEHNSNARKYRRALNELRIYN